MIVFRSIPVIDVGILNSACSEDDLRPLANRFRKVYSQMGFSYLINHGIDPILFEQIFEQAKLFHQLPNEEKMQIKQNEFFRGYMPFATSIMKKSTLGEAIKPNQSAAFILGFEASEDEPDYQKRINLAGPNQWPSEILLPHFKNVLLQYRESLMKLLVNLIRVFALALEQHYFSFDKYFIKPTTFLRLQHYPQQPSVIPEHQYGIAPHTDYGALTLLAQDDVGGLQVLQPDGSWIDVTPLPNALILNTGDMMRLISNDLFIATPHRVINVSGKERYSIPFFAEPDMHAVISPIAQAGIAAKYEPIEYCSHLMNRIKNNYSIGAQ